MSLYKKNVIYTKKRFDMVSLLAHSFNCNTEAIMEIQCHVCSLRYTQFCNLNYKECFDPAAHKPHDSFTNREGQGGEPPAKCILIPVDAVCIGCGEGKN